MNDLPGGKWQFIWKGQNFGTPDEVANFLASLGVSAVSIKVANGSLLYTDLEPYISAIRSKGIKVGGWHYLYSGVYFTTTTEWILTGVTPEREADVSLQAIDLYNLDFFEIDAEREFKVWDQANRASRYMSRLKPPTTIPVGLSSYRFPSYHLEFPWSSFFSSAGGVDYVAPQVYWQTPSTTRGPVNELRQSWSEFQTLWRSVGKTLTPDRMLPAGREYIGDGYPSPGPPGSELVQFMDEARRLGFRGANFWALEYLRLHTGGDKRALAIAEYFWPHVPPVIPPDPDPVAWVQINTTGSYVNVRPQPESGSSLPVSAQTWNGKKFIKIDEVVNSKGEKWLLVGAYVAEWLTKPTDPPA